MKQLLLLALLSLTTLLKGQQLDIGVSPLSLATNSAFISHVEIGISRFSLYTDLRIKFGDTPIVESLISSTIPSSSIDYGLRCYDIPYYNMDNYYLSIFLRQYLTPEVDFRDISPGFIWGFKHVFRNRIFMSADTGIVISSLQENPFVLNIKVGYRIIGDTSRGTKAYYMKDSRWAGSRISPKTEKKTKKKKRLK